MAVRRGRSRPQARFRKNSSTRHDDAQWAHVRHERAYLRARTEKRLRMRVAKCGSVAIVVSSDWWMAIGTGGWWLVAGE